MLITYFGKIKQREGEKRVELYGKKDIVCFQDTGSSKANDLECNGSIL